MNARDILLRIKSSATDVNSQALNASVDDALAAIDLRDLLTTTLDQGRVIHFTGNTSGFVGCSTILNDPSHTTLVGSGGDTPLAALQDLVTRIGPGKVSE